MSPDDESLEPGARHVSLGNIDVLWASGQPLRLTVPGSPGCQIELDPSHDEMSLLTPLVGPEPDVAKLRNITVRPFVRDEEEWAEVRIAVAGAPHGAYSVLASVADHLQLAGESLSVALPRAVADYKTLFAARAGLTSEQEIGLFGELLTIEYLVTSLGSETAISAWAGPKSEEHDVVLTTCHVEIKTTVGERRRHMIGDVQQLVPLRGVPLWLLSIQITRSVAGAGRTVPQLITDLRRAVGPHRADLDARLEEFGWTDELADLCRTVWTLRSAPRCYRVDEDFPALTEARIAESVPRAELLSDVSYRIDVTELAYGDIPKPLASFVETPEETA